MLLLAAATAALAGCESDPTNITDYRSKPIPVGFFVNKELTIAAADGSFMLKGGEQFSTPFVSDLWARMSPALNPDRIIEGFEAARAVGARNVVIRVAGQDKPLYGVLAFSPVYQAAEGPGSRSYQLVIPADKIQAAYSGRTAVAYEDVQYTERWDSGYAQKRQWRSWVLWLSLTPL